MKKPIALALLGLCVSWTEIALSATPAKETRLNDQVADLARHSPELHSGQHKNPAAKLAQKPAEKAPEVRAPVMSAPLGPFSPLHIDP